MALLHLKVANRGVDSEFPHEFGRLLRATGDAESPVVFRGRLGDRGRRTFELVWDNATEGQKWEIKTLFQAAGSVKRMNYIPPDETAIVEVRFVGGSLSIKQALVGSYRISFQVEEALR